MTRANENQNVCSLEGGASKQISNQSTVHNSETALRASTLKLVSNLLSQMLMLDQNYSLRAEQL